MKASEILNRIKAELASAIAPEVEPEVVEVQFAQMTLENGTILEAAEFAPENEVFIVNGEERIALPVGEYALEDGMVLVVAEEGVISEVKELAGEEVEEEAPAAEAPEAEVPVAAAEETPAAKKVIESHTIEQHFSAEDFVSKVEFAAAVEELKALITGLKAAEETLKAELSAAPAAKPIKHNPETKHQEVKFAQKKAKSSLERVLAKINQ